MITLVESIERNARANINAMAAVAKADIKRTFDRLDAVQEERTIAIKAQLAEWEAWKAKNPF